MTQTRSTPDTRSDSPVAPSSGRRRLLAGAGALSAVALAGCAAPAAESSPRPPAPAPRLRVGDRWLYEKVNLYNRMRLGRTSAQVVETAPLLRIALAGVDTPAGTEEIFSEPWRVIQEPGYDLVQVFETPQPLMPSRLEAGARERYAGRYRVPSQAQVPEGADREPDWWFYWSVAVDALRWEDLDVPAGRFETLRILRRISFVHSDPFRMRSRREETLWYAPAVNRWVQREWTGYYQRAGSWPFMAMREDWTVSRLLEYSPARD